MNASMGMTTIYQNAIYDNQLLNNLLVSLQTQASTGKNFANVSDDPADAMEVIAGTDQNQLFTTHLNNIQSATTALNTSVSALQEVDSIFAQAKSIAIEASNSNNDTTSFSAMAQQVNGLITSLLNAANTQNNGVYVFSGTAYNTQPYVIASTDGQGNPTLVTYQGSSGDTSTIVNNNQSVPIYYSGSSVFQANDPQPAVFSGNTGAAAGTGTDSATGQQTLTITHIATTYAAGSGVQPGSSSAAGDTILGPPGSHSLQITDTSGNGSAGTVSLDGGPAIAFTSADTNLQVTNANGDVVYIDTSAITAGFNGSIAISSTGAMSVDGGATSTPITYSANQAVTDGATGAVTFVDTTNLQRTGAETVDHPGSYDPFQALIALRDDLNNVNNLSSADQIQAISGSIADLQSVSTQVESAMGRAIDDAAKPEQLADQFAESAVIDSGNDQQCRGHEHDRSCRAVAIGGESVATVAGELRKDQFDEPAQLLTIGSFTYSTALAFAGEFRIEDFADADGEGIVDDDDFAAGKQHALDEEIDRLGNGAVEADDGADLQLEQIGDGHGGPAELGADADGDVEQVVEGAVGFSRGFGLEFGKIGDAGQDRRAGGTADRRCGLAGIVFEGHIAFADSIHGLFLEQ